MPQAKYDVSNRVSKHARATSGYCHPSYALAFDEFGAIHPLPTSGGWVLVRSISGTEAMDAMGLYPIFACRDWSMLAADLKGLDTDLACIFVVTDPFGNYDERLLTECFPDVHRVFKQHFVIDLQIASEAFVIAHHRRNVERAFQAVEIDRVPDPGEVLDDWVRLYDTLIRRHAIRGLAAFSAASFRHQFKVPGLVVFRARYQDETVGLLLWYVCGDVAYYHLAAYSSRGYELRASFALFWQAIEHFRDAGLRWLSLGAGAGANSNGQDGLTRFKRGWATGTRDVYFCGRIFDRLAYDELCQAQNTSHASDYFPKYRAGEFA